MEHIRQFDWCYSQPDLCFITEEALDNSVTEKILRNRFIDPFISSDSEEETPKIDWDKIFAKKGEVSRNTRNFVPCMPKFIQYPKLSALTSYQQYQCLKVLCSQSPHILPEENLARPTKNDYRVFEDLKPIYEKEQQEFKDWAKTQWTHVHCLKALRPKPPVEQVYEARFKMKANEMQSYPNMFNMAAHIPLETRNNSYDMVLEKDLKSVNIKMLPQVECRVITKKLLIMKQCPVPEPCNKHPCRFILPHEKSVSILPLTEVQRELAQFALDNNAPYIASENALKCLLETDRNWDIPVSVVGVIGADGETTNVVVLGDEFSIHRESAITRTYRAFRHLLQHSLIPQSEKTKLHYRDPNDSITENCSRNKIIIEDEDTSSDEDLGLCIDEDQMSEEPKRPDESEKENENMNMEETKNKPEDDKSGDKDDFYSCCCKDTIFERPPPRSFKKWQVRNKNTNENFDIVIHCSHKVRDKHGEVVLEPIPEYQLELGASAQSKSKIQSLALSLLLRRNATLVNVRIDGATGEIATFESMNKEELERVHGNFSDSICNVLHTALSQLQGLLPGTYVLRHEPSHGSNAILYVSKPSAKPEFELTFNCTQLAEADEAMNLKTPPVIIPLLLPHHKFRRLLPCAFTPNENQLIREAKKLPQRNKTPPKALQLEGQPESGGARSKWPKKKGKKRKRNSRV